MDFGLPLTDPQHPAMPHQEAPPVFFIFENTRAIDFKTLRVASDGVNRAHISKWMFSRFEGQFLRDGKLGNFPGPELPSGAPEEANSGSKLKIPSTIYRFVKVLFWDQIMVLCGNYMAILCELAFL